VSVRIAGICGSLRRASYNAGLLRVAAQRAPEGMEIEILDISGFPLYNGDVEAEAYPDAVRVVRDRVRELDGILFSSPEYNYGVSGVLKNAIDWVSRPPASSPLFGKPVAFMGASTGYAGTLRGQMAYRQEWHFFRAPVFSQAEMILPFAATACDEAGNPTHPQVLERLDTFLAALAPWFEMQKQAKG
jgi:chromate reductase